MIGSRNDIIKKGFCNKICMFVKTKKKIQYQTKFFNSYNSLIVAKLSYKKKPELVFIFFKFRNSLSEILTKVKQIK